MTTSLQELIDDSIFISTEHQARLAELSQGVEWDVDFSVPSFTLQSDPPVVLTPHLLGTDSADRGSWVWSWQELGHFPSEVVAAAVQTRESAARSDVAELITDEVPTQDGFARQVTLAAKALTGLWAHYPARVGKNVTAWLLLDGPELELEPISLETMMRVIAEGLQTGTAVDHNRALDSYAKLRGAHIEWDTDAMCVITTRDGAQRFWLEEHQISGVEPAEATVSDDELTRLEQDARTRREALAADRADARRIADEQAARDTAARQEQEASRRQATAAAAPVSTHDDAAAQPSSDATDLSTDASEQAAEASESATEQPLPAELAQEEMDAPVPGAATEHEQDLPYDQEPRRDVAPGEVTTTTVPSLAEDRDAQVDQPADQPAAHQSEQAAEPAASSESVAESATDEDFAADLEAAVEGDEQAQTEQTETEQAEDRAPDVDGADLDEQRPAVVQPRVEEPATARPIEEDAVAPVETGQPADATEAAAADTSADQPERDEQQDDQPRKKGFFSRFFGL
ncbi:DUF6882 domain-containing protein [Kocuria sp.]|uniref:DUF6882 domain-containing protein n=1 Tax=Kocuria sp. TaxID=1871328 RepID=UPI0026E10007|nr:DUF6882 domain-containing protein [Kocuria sp.]MDO5617459.1 hypothetical protein [Kocuria sp.]